MLNFLTKNKIKNIYILEATGTCASSGNLCTSGLHLLQSRSTATAAATAKRPNEAPESGHSNSATAGQPTALSARLAHATAATALPAATAGDPGAAAIAVRTATVATGVGAKAENGEIGAVKT